MAAVALNAVMAALSVISRNDDGVRVSIMRASSRGDGETQ